MKRLTSVFLFLILSSCTGDHAASPNVPAASTLHSGGRTLPISSGANFRHDELLVKFRPGIAQGRALRLHESAGAKLLSRFETLGIEHIRIPDTTSIRDVLSRYQASPDVEFAEPNYLKHASSLTPSPVTPNDPYFPMQWGLSNSGAVGGVPGADVRAQYAWAVTTGTPGVVIAILDSGIDFTHQDLAANVWANPGEPDCTAAADRDGNGFAGDCRGWNFIGKNNNTLDDNGHGSHVSGIIGAAGNNAIGVTGEMWNVRLMPLKILDATGTGTVAEEIAAVDYAITMKARGINITALNASFSGGDYSQAEFSAVSAANTAGLLLVTAAGNGDEKGRGVNNDTTSQYPGNYALPNIISVAATDPADRLASFSNYGPATVHVAAPGVSILSTVVPGLPFEGCVPFVSGYDFCSGTSMSTPFVTGLAGLLSSVYPGFSHTQIRSTILRYVDVLPSLQGRIATSGKINAFKAVSSLLTPSGLTVAAEPSGTVTLAWTDLATGEDGYDLYRKSDGETFTKIATLGPDAAAYSDVAVSPGHTYTYKVVAFNTIPALSAFSNEASAMLPGLTPTPTPVASGGGGGCSIAGNRVWNGNELDLLFVFLPVAALILLRRKRPAGSSSIQ